MHNLIGMITYGIDEEDAMDRAKHNLEMLVERGCYDYYTLMDDDFSRYKQPEILDCATKQAKTLVFDGMKATIREFRHNLKKIKNLVNTKSTRELQEEVGIDLFKYNCLCLSNFFGYGTYLYDNDAESINTFRHLRNTLNKWNSDDYKGLNVYIIPADVHT